MQQLCWAGWFLISVSVMRTRGVRCFFFVLLARLWLRRLGSDSLGLLMIPGAVLPFLTQFPPALIQSGFSHSGLLDAASDAVTASVCTALILPLAVLFWDWLASLFSLALFSDARKRLKETQRD